MLEKDEAALISKAGTSGFPKPNRTSEHWIVANVPRLMHMSEMAIQRMPLHSSRYTGGLPVVSNSAQNESYMESPDWQGFLFTAATRAAPCVHCSKVSAIFWGRPKKSLSKFQSPASSSCEWRLTEADSTWGAWAEKRQIACWRWTLKITNKETNNWTNGNFAGGTAMCVLISAV